MKNEEKNKEEAFCLVCKGDTKKFIEMCEYAERINAEVVYQRTAVGGIFQVKVVPMGKVV